MVVVGATLDKNRSFTENRLVLFVSPQNKRIMKWVPSKTFPTVDTITPDQWKEKVDIERLEETLGRFENVAADILDVTDHSYLDTLLGCTSEVWDRWHARRLSASSPRELYTGASDSWHARVSAKMKPSPAQSEEGDRVISIGPGFVHTSSAMSPVESLKSLISRCV